MIYLTLMYEFFKIGLFSVGGGMATLPFLMDLTAKYDWFTTSELTNMIAISESTPGPLGINMATYVGYTTAGIPGAILSTLALSAPALFIIYFIAKFLDNFSENKIVKGVFYGIRPTVAGLIGFAVVELLQTTIGVTVSGVFQIDWISVAICAGIFLLLQIKKLGDLHPLCWIVLGGVLGVALQL